MEGIIGYGIAILAILIIGKMLSFPIKLIFKLAVNGIVGAIMLFILNFIGSSFGITVGVNVISALIAGFFGIPGVVFLTVVNLI